MFNDEHFLFTYLDIDFFCWIKASFLCFARSFYINSGDLYKIAHILTVDNNITREIIVVHLPSHNTNHHLSSIFNFQRSGKLCRIV